MRQTRYVISGYGKFCRNLLVFWGLAILLPIRKDENYEKNYLIGKYGAIPTLKSIDIFKGEGG